MTGEEFTEEDDILDALWTIIDYIDTKSGTRPLFHELLKLMVRIEKERDPQYIGLE